MKNLSINAVSYLKKVWHKHGERILVLCALVLVALISFNAGQTHEKSVKSAEISMVINESQGKIAKKEQEVKALGEALERKGIEVIQTQENNNPVPSEESGAVEEQNCALVGSKNSDKYHLPNCSLASKIKQENRVCFSSVEDAKNKGYQSAKCCNK